MGVTARPCPNARPPDTLVHAERLDTEPPFEVVSPSAGFDLERVPQRVPVDVEPAGQRGDGDVVVSDARALTPNLGHGWWITPRLAAY